MMNDKEFSKRYDRFTDTLTKEQHIELLHLDTKRAKIIEEAIHEAKKEVFDDIEDSLFDYGFPDEGENHRLAEQINTIKQRHLYNAKEDKK